jgi:uncharacterized protein
VIVCLDTNTVLQASKRGHPFAPILESWVRGRLVWAVSTDILLEYQEVILRQSGAARWHLFATLMDVVAVTGRNLLLVNPTFRFRVISSDPDDNKFCDCAITAGADYIVTDDSDFAPLADSGYKPKPITPATFIADHLARFGE